MRKFLDRLYFGAGAVAGTCIVLITIMILAQIVGRWFGVIIPSTEDFSGYLLAAATFLALAYTFRNGGHIRVTLLMHRLSPGLQRRLTYGVLLLFVVIMGWGAWHICYLVYESWSFEELSQGYIAIPLWIPQVPMALGAVLFFIALLDDLVCSLQGATPTFLEHEQ
ncbi:MAG TPA: TRAP transporter small permease [Gammaproteobacteria bacterium]|nr:TRAP transporter small permease [Gammaproteobacteria bacterium]